MTDDLPRIAGDPELRARELRSYFSELSADPRAIRVCRGTSCRLVGEPRLPTGAPRRDVYCLGYCDRSPALLLPDGRTVLGEDALHGRLEAALEAPAPTSIRCLSRESIVTERIARGDFSGLERAREAGVYRALRSALAESPESLLVAVEASGERGRGGAGFPTGAKWRACAEAAGSEKIVVANGDEGDPGSFIDRILLERDSHAVLEGMLLCGYAVGASRGMVYVRAEYPAALARMRHAVEQARAAGVLGESVLSSGFAFDVSVHSGHGSYVCGEETALINALEGRRGEVRVRPPYPTQYGYMGRPTVVNNAETLVNAPWIVARGPAAYRALGTRASSGTKALCFNAGFARPGIIEVELGTSLLSLIRDEAGGGLDGQPLAAVAIGGPMGSVLLPDAWDVPLCYGELAQRRIRIGHGGVVAIPAGCDVDALLDHWLGFMRDESCGKCVPCRVGSVRALELQRARGRHDGDAPQRLQHLLETISASSMCAFGELLPLAALEIIRGLASGRSRDPSSAG